MNNKFSQALKGKQDGAAAVEAERAKTTAKTTIARGKHIGGYFDPAAAKQLRQLALDEERSVQTLLAEALDMLFQARGLPMIATRKNEGS